MRTVAKGFRPVAIMMPLIQAEQT